MVESGSIRLSHITKSFRSGGSTITVLQDITTVFQRDTMYSIMGNSGTGKSTLLYILAGFEEPTSGIMFFNERSHSTLSKQEKALFLRRSMGFIFQTPYLLAELSVVENVMVKGLIEGQPYQVAHNHALELLACVGLSSKAYAVPSTLSGGEQQRVSIARALFNKPQFLLADEPTAHLDKKTGKQIIDLLCTYQRLWGMGLIIASHDPAIAYHAHQVLSLENGILWHKERNSISKELTY
jgi:ABC-type lipoprotein export system ATPase subunit